MFRAVPCSSSGGQIVLLQLLVSSLSVNGRTECRLRADYLSQVTNLMHTLFSNYQLNTEFLYSITIYMLQYNPRHVSSSTTLIFRRTNCIITASGIVSLCKRPYSTPAESAVYCVAVYRE